MCVQVRGGGGRRRREAGGGGREAGRRRRAGGRDAEPKTRTPHKDVGNNLGLTALLGCKFAQLKQVQ